MKTLIVYDSQFGNTEKIAKAIGGAISDKVKIVRAGEAAQADLNGIDLLIIGSPTQAGRPTKPVLAFINSLPESSLKNVKTAVFDTRLTTKLVVLFGYAGGCRCSAIWSVGNCSGKMSVYERTDIEYERAEQIIYHERGIGTALDCYRGGTTPRGK